MSYQSLREECYYKTGRKGAVLEAIDMLKPNLFDDNRNINNSIFRRDSKFRFTLVDARKGAGKALYYNLDPNEVILLTYLLSDGVASSFKKRVGAFNGLPQEEQNYLREIIETFDSIDVNRFDRMLDYTKNLEGNIITLQKNINIGNDDLLVRKFSISYEEAMRSSSKWKITIEVGEAKKDSGAGLNIIKYGTYKSVDKTFLLLQANEVVTPINEAAKRVILSQGIFYSKMKEAEIDFTKRKEDNKDYNGEKINIWNPQGKPIVYKKAENIEKKETEVKKETIDKVEKKDEVIKKEEKKKEYTCSDCNVKIDQRVRDYSTRTFKRPLCFNCQSKERSK